MRSLILFGVLAAALSTRAAAQGVDGKATYDENCKKCHGATGTPVAPMKKKYEKLAAFDAAFFAQRSDDSVVAILTNGKGENMKSFKDKLKPEEMAAVAKYIRGFAKAK
ncbi:MAG: c-type cytochrome [Gemmatimonadaceae bacterium]